MLRSFNHNSKSKTSPVILECFLGGGISFVRSDYVFSQFEFSLLSLNLV